MSAMSLPPARITGVPLWRRFVSWWRARRVTTYYDATDLLPDEPTEGDRYAAIDRIRHGRPFVPGIATPARPRPEPTSMPGTGVRSPR